MTSKLRRQLCGIDLVFLSGGNSLLLSPFQLALTLTTFAKALDGFADQTSCLTGNVNRNLHNFSLLALARAANIGYFGKLRHALTLFTSWFACQLCCSQLAFAFGAGDN